MWDVARYGYKAEIVRSLLREVCRCYLLEEIRGYKSYIADYFYSCE